MYNEIIRVPSDLNGVLIGTHAKEPKTAHTGGFLVAGLWASFLWYNMLNGDASGNKWTRTTT